MCNGGHITYFEFDDYPEASVVERLINYAYNSSNISYIGINFHVVYCKKCNARVNQHATSCKCGSYELQGLTRVTGYIALDERFGPGKAAERADRLSCDTLAKAYDMHDN